MRYFFDGDTDVFTELNSSLLADGLGAWEAGDSSSLLAMSMQSSRE